MDEERACATLVNIVKADNSQIFVIDSVAGLTGNQMVRQYPCLLNKEDGKFYVLLGDADISLFSKSTFMNLCNFAENQSAKSMVLMLNRDHDQKNAYRRMFKVLDALRMKEAQVTPLLKADQQVEAVSEFSFHMMEL